MRLYHGTNMEIKAIDLNQSRIGKDFGLGFYLTTERNVAFRQAERKFVQYGEGNVRVYEFEVDEETLRTLNVLIFEEYSLEWAQFVLKNRKNRTRKQVHNYDVVIGPIANDVVGYQIRRVEEGIISEEQFLEEIKFHTVTVQYLFATENAVRLLQTL